MYCILIAAELDIYLLEKKNRNALITTHGVNRIYDFDLKYLYDFNYQIPKAYKVLTCTILCGLPELR